MIEPGFRDWWQVYLDNFASAQLRDEYELAEAEREPWQRWHSKAETGWESVGIISSEKKRVRQAEEATELGAYIDGRNRFVGGSPLRVLKTAKLILFLVVQEFTLKDLQTVVGRIIFLMSFRRPAMAVFTHVWTYISRPRLRKSLLPSVRRELFNSLLLLPLLKQDLTAEVADMITCSDASQKGGASAVGTALTQEGINFLASTTDPVHAPQREPILVISLFNGIGGAFRAYDLLGIAVEGAVYSEINKAACRTTDRRWPHARNLGDIRTIDEAMIRTLAIRYATCTRIDVWCGFPCVDLSAVNCFRTNLKGSQSSLLFEALRVTELVKKIFPPCVIIHHIFENVSSMDVQARHEITQLVGSRPWKLDPRDVLPISRPRLAWTSFQPQNFEGMKCEDKGEFVEISMEAPGLQPRQWLEPGWQWGNGETQLPFPCFMKAIPRRAPPPRPVGLDRCSDGARGRWEADRYRFPPYQYKDEHMLWKEGRWRTLTAAERELLMGFGFEHTSLCWGANAVKSDPQGFEDTRKSLIGDSFCMLSFAAVLASSFKWTHGSFSIAHLVQRLGLAPGYCTGWAASAPVVQHLNFGQTVGASTLCRSVRDLNKVFLQRTNHTGGDVRLVTGHIMGKHQTRQSVPSSLWSWRFLFQNKWQLQEHINALEMRQALNTLNWVLRDRQHFNLRWVHCSDSFVTISILCKGRTSSRQLEGLVRRFNSHLLLAQVYPILLHVASLDNPTDEGSRHFSDATLAR